MKKTTIETTEVELRGLLSFAYDNPAAKNMHGVFVSEGRLAACSPFALAVRGDPTLPWVERRIIPYRAIEAACVRHGNSHVVADVVADNGCDWRVEEDLSDVVVIEVGAKSYKITRRSASVDLTISCAIPDSLCPDLGMVVHGLRGDALAETLIDPRIFGRLEALRCTDWRMDVAGEGQPVRFTSRLGRWTVFAMPMRSGA